ncbi:DUF1848 domain-containing protein [Mycoplasmatota bacterium]|nr:DUF1848 domain-containing protein [Mycoplasmatota bacterium]
MTGDKVISVSRRTDIPAFYTDWFINGIKRGYVDSINPFNRKYVSRVSLLPEDVTCFVFWTKNPKPIFKFLPTLDRLGYKYYFQYTLTSYSNDIEKLVPNKSNDLINTFKMLSDLIGKDKVIWRYDPIILTEKYNKEYHYKYFEEIMKRLKDCTNRVVISFVDLYNKTEINTRHLNIKNWTPSLMREVGYELAKISKRYNLEIQTCSEEVDLSEFGIEHGKCIDDRIISKITNKKITKLNKDKGQRKACGCVESIDIGSNNTCKHLCFYCYANISEKTVLNNVLKHNPNSALLVGELVGDETIHWRNGIKYLKSKEQIKNKSDDLLNL